MYTDYALLEGSLTLENFKFVEEAEKADIIYLSKDMSLYKELARRPEQYINQFPYESTLVMKHNLD